MSDSSMYELESITWDDFSESYDHRVPYPDGNQFADFDTQGDSCDKPRHRKVVASRKRLDKTPPAKDVILRRQDANCSTLKDRTAQVQETGSWSHVPESVCPDVNETDYLKEVTSLASDDVNVSTNCPKNSKPDSLDNDFFKDGAVFDEKDAAIDGNLCHFPLDDIFSDGSNLDFLGDESENKKHSYLSCYEWPDIDKLDDFDKMFRGYDSTFVPGNVTNEDKLSLLSSSSHDVDGSEDVLNSGFKFSCPESSTLRDHQGDVKFSENDSPLITSSGGKNSNNTHRMIPWALDSAVSATLTSSSFVNWSCSKAEDKTISVFEEQCMESSCDLSPNSTEYTPEEKMKKLHLRHQKQTTSSIPPQYEGLADHTTSNGRHRVHNEIGSYCEVEGLRMEVSPAELGSSNVQDRSCMSSISSEEVSLKTAGFRQLELVVEQLDVRTKLCIRDSLYRLARSAKQRHNLGPSDNHIRDGEDKSEGTTIEEHDRCTRFVDVETHTNSIDRSLAQLLFHRPAEPAKVSTSLQSHAKIHGSSMGQSLLHEDCREETACNVDG